MQKDWGAMAAGDVMCPLFLHNCASRPFAHAQVVGALNVQTSDTYLAARDQLVGQDAVWAHGEEQARIEAAEEERRVRMTALEREADDCKRHIAEQILTLKCPRCGQGIYDFNGCFALACSRADCQAGICAWCLTDCDTDAHAHVANCPRGLHDLRQNPVYGTLDQFHQVHHARKTKELRAYLAGLPTAELQRRVIAACYTGIPDFGRDFSGVVVAVGGDDGAVEPNEDKDEEEYMAAVMAQIALDEEAEAEEREQRQQQAALEQARQREAADANAQRRQRQQQEQRRAEQLEQQQQQQQQRQQQQAAVARRRREQEALKQQRAAEDMAAQVAAAAEADANAAAAAVVAARAELFDEGIYTGAIIYG
jgi:chemotaxis protein histidine kinase CheA